jgi:hypothetical protein
MKSLRAVTTERFYREELTEIEPVPWNRHVVVKGQSITDVVGVVVWKTQYNLPKQAPAECLE